MAKELELCKKCGGIIYPQFVYKMADDLIKRKTEYPFDKCVTDRKKDGYSEESAQKICGKINALYGHHYKK